MLVVTHDAKSLREVVAITLQRGSSLQEVISKLRSAIDGLDAVREQDTAADDEKGVIRIS